MILKRQIPNFLTVLRLLLSPVVLILFWFLDDRFYLVAVLFVFCCFTDFLDGYLSRKWKAESSFGKTFDPVADKVLLVGMLILMLIKQKVIGFVGVALISRDILMDVTRILLYRKRKIIPAILTAKIKTVLQMIGVALILFWPPGSAVPFFPANKDIYLQQVTLLLAMIFSL